MPQPSATGLGHYRRARGDGVQPIIVKQTVKQHIGDEYKRKKKAVKQSNKHLLGKRRKFYNDMKKKTIKAITSGKNAHYKRENEKIKTLPKKKRKEARAKLKAELASRKKELVTQLPAAGRMKLADLERLITKVKRLKW